VNGFRFSRGNAVPETALTMGLVLLLLLGLVKLTLVGYEQSEADGAAFVAARAASLTTDPSQQANRGETHAKDIFTRVPGNNIVVAPGSTGGPNGTGEVVGSSYRLTSGLFSGSFGTGAFDLKSHFIEPVIGSGTNPPPLLITQSNLVNCVSQNPATPSCGANGLPSYMAQYDPSNKTNPYYQYACHLAAYLPLANGTPGSGTVPGATPWPEDYQPTTPGSINWPAVRNSGIYLNPNGTLGTALTTMYSWSSSKPC
jgi:hypothetical protein